MRLGPCGPCRTGFGSGRQKPEKEAGASFALRASLSPDRRKPLNFSRRDAEARRERLDNHLFSAPPRRCGSFSGAARMSRGHSLVTSTPKSNASAIMMEERNLSGSGQSGIETTDSPTVLGLAGRILAFVACVGLFPYGFFLVQAFRRTMTWRKAMLNTGVLLLIHGVACALIVLSDGGASSMARPAGFLLAALNIWLGYDWQVRGMTASNGYADWQRALKWLGVFLKVLALGAIIVHFTGR